MLLLAVHTVHDITARVPLSQLVLLDIVKRKSLPPNLKCRQVLPSSKVSISLWEADSVEEVLVFLNDNINQDCSTEVYEVDEQFTFGVSLELSRARAAEKVSAGSRNTLDRISASMDVVGNSVKQQLEILDQKTRIISATKEATNSAVTKVKAATDKVVENEKVASALQTVQTGVQASLSKARQSWNWVGAKVLSMASTQLEADAGGVATGVPVDDYAPHAHGMAGGYGGPPPSYDHSGMYTAPHGGSVPVSTQAPTSGPMPTSNDAVAAAWGRGTTNEPVASFTLDDDHVAGTPHTDASAKQPAAASNDGAVPASPASASAEETK